MRSIILSALISLISGCCTLCPTEPDNGCVVANFVTYGCCTGTTVFEISSPVGIGDSITLHTAQGKLKLKNAIQIAGKYDDNMLLKLRAFNQELDSAKVVPECWCFLPEPWAELPMYVIAEDCVGNPE